MSIREIDGFEGYYVDDEGNVWSKKYKDKKLSQAYSKDGYKLVALWKDGKLHTKKVHRLVGMAFIPNPDNKPEIGHKDCIRDNNIVENLYWCTREENNGHPITRKRNSESHKGICKGRPKPEGAGRQPKPVIQYTKEGEFVARYESAHEAARQTGLGRSAICSSCRGVLPHYKGFLWQYA